MINNCGNVVIVQLELLQVLANIDCNFTVYLESVGLTSLSTMNSYFLDVSCNLHLFVPSLCIMHYSEFLSNNMCCI